MTPETKSISYISTYSFSLYDSRFFALCEEAGYVYEHSLNEFWKVWNEEKRWMSSYVLQAHMKDKIERKLLCSDSYLAAIQEVHKNLASWKEAKKVCPEAKAPYKTRHLKPLVLKQDQIVRKEDQLRLTIGTNKEYVWLPWAKELPVPHYGRIRFDRTKGWKIDLCVENVVEQKELDHTKTMSGDLGVKRIITTFDGDTVKTYSGKKFMELNHYENKKRAKNQLKQSKQQKDSKNNKKQNRSERKSNERIQNKKKEMLHKVARAVVNDAVDKNIGRIVIGDCASIHDEPNLGPVNNQKISQNPEQQLRKYIEYKFLRISGESEVVPEPYTSQKCPCCHTRNKPKNRTYKCSSCGFLYDRDGVGCINIGNENVSSDRIIPAERIRALMAPIGIKFRADGSIGPKRYVNRESIPIPSQEQHLHTRTSPHL